MASRLCQAVRAELVASHTLAKEDRSPVTVADFGAQAVVCQTLLRHFPDLPVVAEETSAALRKPEGAALREQVVHYVHARLPGATEAEVLDAIDRGRYAGGPHGRYWVLDPIDGTKGFLRGEQYAVALGLIEEGEVVMGVLGCPNLPLDASRDDGPKGCLLIAAKGQGATMRSLDDPAETPVGVSDVADPSDAVLCESVEAGHSSHGDAARVAEILGATAPRVRMDSQCKYAAVARGDASVYLRLPTRRNYTEKIWDHAAGSVVVREAGGEVTDMRGRPLDFSVGRQLRRNGGIVATNGRLHAQVLAAVRQVLASR